MQWLTKNLSDNFRYCKKKKKSKIKNLDSEIKTFESPKNIKKSDDSLLRNYETKQNIYD